MKSEKISIKWKIFCYLLSFIIILLVLLWLFQTVYLDDFYKRIKKNEIDKAAKSTTSVINDESISDEINTIAQSYDICILITDLNGNKLYSAETSTNCAIHKLRQDMLKKLCDDAKENNNELEINVKNNQKDKVPFFDDEYKNNPREIFDSNDNMNESVTDHSIENSTEKTTDNLDKTDNNKIHQNIKIPNIPNDNGECLIKVIIVTGKDGTDYAIMLNSVITPVNATVHTLRIQLIYISVILILLSLLIGFIISRRVSKSIIKVNDSAKELAKGNFDIEFTGKDYKEIAELSETLNYSARELAKTDVLQKELIANVSHDLRTPLTMITAYSEVMRDIPGENTPENVQVIIDEAKRLTMLVNDLLDMSKIQAGVSELETKEYDLTESINAAIIRHSKLLEPYGYHVIFNYDQHVIVKADEFKIYQVIYNLLGNAVNYTGEDKKITIDQIIQEDHVMIKVSDTGEGIPEDKLDSVWERYYKDNKNHKRAIMGTGLGLSIVKNILKLHKAEYGVTSKIGCGTTFWFKLNIIKEISNEGKD